MPPPAEHLRYNSRRWLREFARWAKGDPELTAFEAAFVNSLAQYAEIPGHWLTKKQLAVVERLTSKLGYDEKERAQPALVDDDADAEELSCDHGDDDDCA